MTAQTLPLIPEPTLNPENILRTAFGFFASKTLLSAAEIGVFTELACRPLDGEALRERLQLHPRASRDFLDALVALGLLEREAGVYRNSPEADQFLDRAKPSYIGGVLEMASRRLYLSWAHLTDALRTGRPQNDVRDSSDPFAALYADPQRMREFLQAMTGLSVGAAEAIAREFPWEQYDRFADIGCAQGGIPVQVALAHPHLTGVGFDLPAVAPVFDEYVDRHGLGARLRFQAGDMFAEPLPRADVLIFGHILHDWDLEAKRTLLAKAHAALTDGGAVIVYESLIDDARRESVSGLLMSLNMLIETPGGFDFTGADCREWMREAGFRHTYVEHLTGPDAMVVGIK